MPPDPLLNRRPLASRRLGIMQRLASVLARAGVTPNQISVAGIVFALLAAGMLWQAAEGWAAGWLLAILLIQLRLLANLIDGMVAVEGGRGDALGPLYNEVPDRIEDTAILAAFGLAAGWPSLGLWAAIAAVSCAYIRQLGGALGQAQSFIGPMAKPQRMAAVTFGCAVGFIEALAGSTLGLTGLILWVIFLGTLVTIARRLMLIAAGLR